MPKILCTIPGAPEEIGGLNGLVKFAQSEAGLVADVDDDEAANFLSIPGYSLAEEDGKKAADAAAQAAADAAEREALMVRAAAVNLEVTSSWKLPRLRKEVEHAESEAAKKTAPGGA